MGIISKLFELVIGLVVIILAIMLLWHVAINGAHYGALLGDAVSGIIDFGQALFNHTVG